MTASTSDLMGVGMPFPQALRLGWQTGTLTGAGTAQGGSSPTVLGGFVYRATTSSGQTAVTLGDTAQFPPGDQAIIHNTTSTAMLLFPPSGGNINGGSTDASFSVAQNKPVIITRYDATRFIVVLSA